MGIMLAQEPRRKGTAAKNPIIRDVGCRQAAQPAPPSTWVWLVCPKMPVDLLNRPRDRDLGDEGADGGDRVGQLLGSGHGG
jgi:hypothetical protein